MPRAWKFAAAVIRMAALTKKAAFSYGFLHVVAGPG
jgi:hypothetical protein